MKFAEDNPNEGYIITAYDDSSIQVNGKNFENSLVISRESMLENWAPCSINDLQSEHFNSIIEFNPELVLLGTGTTLSFPKVETYAELIKMGVAVDVMDTGAACRTYNILMGEGRHVIAGLILPG